MEVEHVAAQKELLVRRQLFQGREVGLQILQVGGPPGPQADLIDLRQVGPCSRLHLGGVDHRHERHMAAAHRPLRELAKLGRSQRRSKRPRRPRIGRIAYVGLVKEIIEDETHHVLVLLGQREGRLARRLGSPAPRGDQRPIHAVQLLEGAIVLVERPEILGGDEGHVADSHLFRPVDGLDGRAESERRGNGCCCRCPPDAPRSTTGRGRCPQRSRMRCKTVRSSPGSPAPCLDSCIRSSMGSAWAFRPCDSEHSSLVMRSA